MEKKIEESLEEKYSNRFLVEFPKELNLPSWTVKTANKPKFANAQWLPLTISFIDPIKHSTSKALYELIKIADVQNNYKTKVPILFEIEMKILDKVGEVVEHWKISVNDVQDIDFGDLAYDNNIICSTITPKLTIIPQNCEYVTS